MNNTCPRLIEVALPVREISAESVRDKSLRHGHISTLHLWWARRPLAASRAVVFASLVPDPDDPRCPEEFRRTVERHLKTHVPAELKHYRRGREVLRDEDPYRPYLPAEASAQAGGPFWKLAQALFEVLPRDLEDWKLVNALLSERETMKTEGKRIAYKDTQQAFSFQEGGL